MSVPAHGVQARSGPPRFPALRNPQTPPLHPGTAHGLRLAQPATSPIAFIGIHASDSSGDRSRSATALCSLTWSGLSGGAGGAWLSKRRSSRQCNPKGKRVPSGPRPARCPGRLAHQVGLLLGDADQGPSRGPRRRRSATSAVKVSAPIPHGPPFLMSMMHALPEALGLLSAASPHRPRQGSRRATVFAVPARRHWAPASGPCLGLASGAQRRGTYSTRATRAP